MEKPVPCTTMYKNGESPNKWVEIGVSNQGTTCSRLGVSEGTAIASSKKKKKYTRCKNGKNCAQNQTQTLCGPRRPIAHALAIGDTALRQKPASVAGKPKQSDPRLASACKLNQKQITPNTCNTPLHVPAIEARTKKPTRPVSVTTKMDKLNASLSLVPPTSGPRSTTSPSSNSLKVKQCGNSLVPTITKPKKQCSTRDRLIATAKPISLSKNGVGYRAQASDVATCTAVMKQCPGSAFIKLNKELHEALQHCDLQQVIRSLDPTNQWSLKLRLWHTKQLVRLSGEDARATDEMHECNPANQLQLTRRASISQSQKLEIEISFLEKCLEAYKQAATSSEPNQAKHETKTLSSSTLGELFHFKRAGKLAFEDTDEEVDVFELSSKVIISDSHHIRFCEAFRQLLEYRYAHLPENFLFGDPNQSGTNEQSDNHTENEDQSARVSDESGYCLKKSDDGMSKKRSNPRESSRCDDSNDDSDRVLLLDDFEQIVTCSKLEEYLDFFTTHFHSFSKVLVTELAASFTSMFEDMATDWKPADFQQTILEEVTTFCISLINSRTGTMELFEKFEKELYEMLTSYRFLKEVEKDSTSWKGIAEQLIAVEDMHEAYKQYNQASREYTTEKQELYQTQLTIFTDLLTMLECKHLVEQDTYTELLECLKSRRNHYSYLQEYLNHLKALLSPTQNCYDISCEEKDGSQIFSAKAVAGTFAGFKSAFETWMLEHDKLLSSGDEIRLSADAVVYADTDLDHFAGVNVACIAPRVLSKKEDEVMIKTDGLPIEDLPKNESALSGEHGTESNKHGRPGKDGENGCYGNAGGHILLVADSVCSNDFTLSANGSQGEDGQNGGNGGDGWSPTEKGRDGATPSFRLWDYDYEEFCYKIDSDSVIINYGTYGQDGGQGGDAGMGGAAGRSGISGKIQLIDLGNDENCQETQESIEDGEAGLPGEPGRGGKCTRHGKDYGGYAKEPGFWKQLFDLSSSDIRDINLIKGALTHQCIPHRPGSGNGYEESGEGLPTRVKSENDPDFYDRGKSRNGKKAQTKVNPTVAKENKAINKQACFRTVYDQYRQSLRHWNVNSHNHFLSAFAQKIGESYQSKFVSLTHSDVVKSGSAVWIARIERQSQALQASLQEQTRLTQRAQVQVMKDFTEETRHKSLGYLNCRKPKAEPLLIDMSVFQMRSGQPVKNIKVESILFSDERDSKVESLLSALKLSEKDVVVMDFESSPSLKHRHEHQFLIIKYNTSNYRLYHCGSDVGTTINEPTLLMMLNKIHFGENKFLRVPRDDLFYPQLATWIHQNFGRSSTVPCTYSQLRCVLKLRLLVTIRKTYRVIGGKYATQIKILLFLQKVFSSAIDDIVDSVSCETLYELQEQLEKDHFLISPLDISWLFSSSALKDIKAQLLDTVTAFNKAPSLENLLCILECLYRYHIECLAESQESYLNHLSSETFLLKLKVFYVHMCGIARIFCNETQIIEEPAKIPSVASSECLVQRIKLEQEIDCGANQKALGEVLASIKERFPPLLTVIDSFFTSLLENFHNITGADISEKFMQSQLTKLPSKLSFRNVYAAFQAFPTVSTLKTAMSTYEQSTKKTKAAIKAQPLQDLFSFFYDSLAHSLSSLKYNSKFSDLLAQLSDAGLCLEWFYQCVKSILNSVSKENPAYLAIASVWYILDALSITQVQESACTELDPTSLQRTIPPFLQEIQLLCEQLCESKQCIDTISANTISLCVDKLQIMLQTFQSYPFSCPSPWLQHFEKCILTTLGHVTTAVDNSIEIKPFKELLEGIIPRLNSLKALHQTLELIKGSGNLEQFSLLHNMLQSREQCELLVKYGLSLHDRFLSSSCLHTLASWIYPDMAIQYPWEVRIRLERLSPQYKVLISTQEPDDVSDDKTMVLYQDESQWMLRRLSSTLDGDLNCSDVCVSSEIVETVLKKSIKELELQKSKIVRVPSEIAAQLLGRLNYDKEIRTRIKIQLCGQVVCDELNEEDDFIVAFINLKTCETVIHSKGNQKETALSESKENVVIIYSPCTSSALVRLKKEFLISDELLCDTSVQTAVALCIIKHPDKPVIVYTVEKCGDVVEAGFKYLSHLVTSVSHESSPLQLLQPISELLHYYEQLYQTHLPMDLLNRALEISMKELPKIVYIKDIPNLVISTRRHFVRLCITTHSNINSVVGQNLKIIGNEVLSFKCTSFILEHVLLKGLESFSCFLLSASSKSSEANLPCQIWKCTLERKVLVTDTVLHLFLAAAYIFETNETDHILDYEDAFVRYDTYRKIAQGLTSIRNNNSQACRGKKLNFKIMQLLERISTLIEDYPLELLIEVSGEVKNERKFNSLFCVIQTIKPLREDFLKTRSVVDCTFTRESCLEMIQSDQLYQEATMILLSWSSGQQHKINELLQVIITADKIFLQDSKKELLIDTMSSWLMKRTEKALAECDWERIPIVILIGQKLVTSFQSDMLSVLPFLSQSSEAGAFECRDFISDLLTVIQVIRVTPDLLRVWEIISRLSNSEWLKSLLAYNLLRESMNYFGYESEKVLSTKLLSDDLHPKLLQILYNVFVNDVINTRTSVGTITIDQLLTILDLLSLIEPCLDAHTSLRDTPISLWEKVLAEINFKQYLDHWKDLTETDKQRTLFLMNRVRLNAGMCHLDFMQLLRTMQSKSICEDSSFLMIFFEDLYYDRVTLQEANSIVISSDCNEWASKFTTLKNSRYTRRREARDTVAILDLIESQIKTGDFSVSKKEFEQIKDEAQQIIDQVCRISESLSIDECTLHEFFKELQVLHETHEITEWMEKNRVQFVVYVVAAWILVTSKEDVSKMQIPYKTQVISILLFLHTNDKGILQQVKTGEGKTLIVGMLAAAKALLGYHVDIVSSNRDLAQDGMRKCQQYFELLGLQAAVNCTDDDDVNQQAYRSHIVYGDVGSFQRDVLKEESDPGGTNFSVRYSDLERNCLIVDEVDSMFLDKGRHMLYLSHESPALKHLESLFVMIWSSVLGINNTQRELKALPIDTILSELADQLLVLVENKTISIPEYLTDFCRHKMKAWVRSAYQARIMNANDQFIIDHKNEEEEATMKKIFPIDKQTGIEQYNMKWSNGLSQFLELKYRRPLSTESLKAVFISNKRFFKRYGRHLYGLTGTLGSVSSRRLLQAVYNIQTLELPTNRAKRYTQHKHRVATSNQEWCELIYKEIATRIEEQPVLVICENIEQLLNLQKHLESQSCLNAQNITLYARDGHDVEQKFKNQDGAKPGQVILATNKGGRGTDIIIKEENVPRGLHVIVSFLPENTRIEEQAFGRAARAGQAGSGCLIIQIDPTEYKETLQEFKSIEAATETLVEMEKIRRDQKEASRLSFLLSDGLPKLDLEESLYLQFQEHKREFASTINSTTLFGVQIRGAAKKACVEIVTNRWAFWLDSVRTQIQAADTPEKRNEIETVFKRKFPKQGLLQPSSDSDSPFFRMPEDYIQLGQAFLKEVDSLEKSEKAKSKQVKRQIRATYSAALTCFERANDKGDRTGLPSMTACYCFIKLHPEPSDSHKRSVRRYLKTANSHMEALRQSWMTNGEVGRSLADLVNVSQYIDSDENHYTKQIEEKIKVIGLHVHQLGALLGIPVDETAFFRESPLSAEKISEEQSKEIYKKLSNYGVICHYKVRRCWKKNRSKLRTLIQREVEPLIAEDLIELILRHRVVEESDLMHLVFNCDELWDILSPLRGSAEDVVVIEVEQIDSNLSESDEDLFQSWSKFRSKLINSRYESLSSHTVLPVSDPICKALHNEEFQQLAAYLKNNTLYIDTQRAALTAEASELVHTIELGKYEPCKIIDKDGESHSLRSSLAEILKYCDKVEGGYVYKHMLPYSEKLLEAKKIHVFLQQHEILKSGQLAMHKCDDSKLKSSIEAALGSSYSKEQTAHVADVVQGMQGEVRGFERDMKVGFVDFYNLENHPEDIPETLDFFTSWHMDYFLTLEQKDKGWWDWNAFACAMIGLAQVIAGAALVVLTAGAAAQFGSALIAEGINDMVYATIAGLTGTFSWKDWAIQKAISIAISIATAGIGALASYGKTTSKVGSAAASLTFGKVIAKAAGQFALSAAVGIISDVVLAEAQQQVVTAIVDWLKEKIFSQVRGALRSRLTRMAAEATSDDDFHAQCAGIKSKLESALKMSSFLPDHFEQIRSQVASCLKQNYNEIANNLSRSNSKWAKVAGNAAKAALIVNKVYTVVRGVVEVTHLIQAVCKLVDSSLVEDTATTVGSSLVNGSQTATNDSRTNVKAKSSGKSTSASFISDYNDSEPIDIPITNQGSSCTQPVKRKFDSAANPISSRSQSTSPSSKLIERELAGIEGVFLAKIETELQQKLKGALQKIIRSGLKKVAKATKKAATKCVKKVFKGKSPSEVVRELHNNPAKHSFIGDHHSGLPEATPSENLPALPIEADLHAAAQQKRIKLGNDIVEPQCHQTAGDGGSTRTGHTGGPTDGPNGGSNGGSNGGPTGTGPTGAGTGPTGTPNGDNGNQNSHNRKEKNFHPSDIDPSTFKEYSQNGKMVRKYKQFNGVSVKIEDTFQDGQLVKREGKVKGLKLGQARAPSTPLEGMFDRLHPPGPRSRENDFHNFHGAPACGGLGNTEHHGTSAISSPSYNSAEEKQCKKIRKKIGKGNSFQAHFVFEFESVKIDNPEEYIKQANAARGAHKPQIDSSNAAALKERANLFHEKGIRRIKKFKCDYKSSDGKEHYGTVKLGRDYELCIPKRFNKPRQPAQFPTGEISEASKREVHPLTDKYGNVIRPKNNKK